jgi:hypothetical protein
LEKINKKKPKVKKEKKKKKLKNRFQFLAVVNVVYLEELLVVLEAVVVVQHELVLLVHVYTVDVVMLLYLQQSIMKVIMQH